MFDLESVKELFKTEPNIAFFLVRIRQKWCGNCQRSSKVKWRSNVGNVNGAK